jgi:hypothetical protein
VHRRGTRQQPLSDKQADIEAERPLLSANAESCAGGLFWLFMSLMLTPSPARSRSAFQGSSHSDQRSSVLAVGLASPPT